MRLTLLTLSLIAALTQGAFADEAQAVEGETSFSSSAPPPEWASRENFTAGARKQTLDVVDSIMSNDRIPAATTDSQSH